MIIDSVKFFKVVSNIPVGFVASSKEKTEYGVSKFQKNFVGLDHSMKLS